MTNLIVVTGEQFPDGITAAGLAGFLDRCDTGDSFCGRTDGTPPDTFRTVLVASGVDYADALSAGSYAYRNGHLLVLSTPSTATAVTLVAGEQFPDALTATPLAPPAATPTTTTPPLLYDARSFVLTCDYPAGGPYTIAIGPGASSGDWLTELGGFAWHNSDVELVSIESFGDLGLTTLFGLLAGVQNEVSVPDPLPGLVKDTSYLFYLTPFNDTAVAKWDVSNVETMEALFYRAMNFNADISGWNVSKVTKMGYMFENATSFNRDLSGWCVSKIGTKPFRFDEDASAWTLVSSRPNWGTCPRGEDAE